VRNVELSKIRLVGWIRSDHLDGAGLGISTGKIDIFIKIPGPFDAITRFLHVARVGIQLPRFTIMMYQSLWSFGTEKIRDEATKQTGYKSNIRVITGITGDSRLLKVLRLPRL
jgi:hypothetical protein